MFDNNQNFNNNPKPLFENDFNNINLNNQNQVDNNNSNMNFQNSFTNNYNEMNNFNVQNNIPNSFESSMPSNNFFANDFYNPAPLNSVPSNNPSFENSSSQVDIPPELGEIKNLSDATVSSAPTMDVLGPMNVMPENPNFNNDPIIAYENGSINLPQSNDFDVNFNAQPNLDTLNQNINSDSVIPSFDFNLNNNVSSSFENSNDNNFNSVNESASPFSNIEKNNELVKDISNLTYDASSDFNMSFQKTSSESQKTFDFSSSSFGNLDNDLIQGTLPLENEFNLADSLNNKEMTEVDVPIYPSLTEKKNDDVDYTIVQDKIIEEKEPTSNTSNLVMNDSYDEEDTLDIMDFEEENEQESQNDDSNNGKPLLIENIEKIKNLITELKNSGADIKLEEFDFEHMYQLIVKINK